MSSTENNSNTNGNDLYSRLTGLGYEDELVIRLLSLSTMLVNGTFHCLERTTEILRAVRKQTPLTEDDLKIIIAIPRTEVFPREDVLLPEWKQLADALCSMPIPVSKQGYIELVLNRVQMSKDVADLLLPSLKMSPIRVLRLWNSSIGSDSIKIVANTVKINGTLEVLDIESGRIESEHDLESLVNAVVDHPQIDTVFFDECGLGNISVLMARIAPLLRLKTVGLKGNFIGSDGARIIANSLADNPCVEHLYLRDNLLGDGDARMFANSLETNTNLQLLTLAGNQITTPGARVLSRALVNFSSLDAMNDCNHTCCVDLGDEDLLVKRNIYCDPDANREIKLLNLLTSSINILYTDKFHIGLMPRIIDLIQLKGKNTVDYVTRYKGLEPRKYNCLNGVFLFIREWNMPLLYTSCIGPKLRRSERIRKNKVAQLLRK